MDASQIYVLIGIVVLAIIAVLVFFVNKKKNKKHEKLSPLVGIAFGFMIAGIVFGGDDRLIGYSLIGIGIILAIWDMIRKSKK